MVLPGIYADFARLGRWPNVQVRGPAKRPVQLKIGSTRHRQSMCSEELILLERSSGRHSRRRPFFARTPTPTGRCHLMSKPGGNHVIPF